MNSSSLSQHEWQDLLAHLPHNRQQAARECGAFTRKRQIQSPDDLLRLLFVYAWAGYSLRNTAAWAAQQQVANLSDVALLERFQKATPWLEWLVGQMLHKRRPLSGWETFPYRVSLQDATVLCQPGSQGTDWRVHLRLDLKSQQIQAVQLTDAHVGEAFSTLPVERGDLIVGDRGHATRAGLHFVVSAGAEALVRFSAQNLPLQTLAGSAFDLLAHLNTLEEGEVGEWDVQTAPDPKACLGAITGRVIAYRKPKAQAEAARRKARQEAKKKGKTLGALALAGCDFVLLFTTVPASAVTAGMLCALYRFRWQIECGFKRLKSDLGLDALPAFDARLCRAWIYAKLLGALLCEEYAHSWVSFSPGSHRRGGERELETPVADAMAFVATGGRGEPLAVGVASSYGVSASSFV